MINLLQNKLESLDWTAPAFKCDQKNKNKNKKKQKRKKERKGRMESTVQCGSTQWFT